MPKNETPFATRPLAGLPLEPELVAMREILPAAVATATLAPPSDPNEDSSDGPGTVQFVTFLPQMARAFKRPDSVPVVALQPPHPSNDVSQDLGNALTAALLAEPGSPAEPALLGSPGPRLQDLIDPDGPVSFALQTSFEYWTELDPDDKELADAAVKSGDELTPTELVGSVPGAYWASINGREYLRWSLGVEEDVLLNALARLQAKRQAGVTEGSKYAGAFRALGLVIPVWDLPTGTTAADLAGPLETFKTRLDEALANEAPLDAAERRSRAGLVARFLTLR
ncbi:MAG: DUF5926 family protein [Bifidobacteriaceae bacterium]|jgi:hypothetical protein|nr:DUF5926 family protein [Bifidobacteriaceae bacterium]